MIVAECLGCYPETDLPYVDDTLVLVARQTAKVTGEELVPLHKATGRVLAQDVRAKVASPAYDRSAMDGFAYRFGAEIGAPLHCVGRARAGMLFEGDVGAEDCISIATGGALPPGCDTVVMREQCAVTGDRVAISGPIIQGQHVRRLGEDFQVGDVLLTAGTRLAPQHLGLLASAGLFEAHVYRRIRTAVLSIGDELSTGTAQLQAPQIFDANRPMLLAFCERAGANVTDLGILPDRRERIVEVLRREAATHDVVICSASTSKGDEDHVRTAVGDCGGNILIAGVAIKPGKPVTFAKIGDCLLIALPGNPAAALVTFLTMGAAILRQVTGEIPHPTPPQLVRATFAYQKKQGLRDYLRVALYRGADGITQAQHCAKDGSGMLSSLAESEGFVWLTEDTAEIVPGDLLPFHSFEDFLG